MADYKNTIFVCDVETGGLPSALKKRAVHEVALTEIAFVVLDNVSLERVDKKSWLIKPYHSDLIYDPKAAEVSNITKEMVLCSFSFIIMDIFSLNLFIFGRPVVES